MFPLGRCHKTARNYPESLYIFHPSLEVFRIRLDIAMVDLISYWQQNYFKGNTEIDGLMTFHPTNMAVIA